MEIGYIKGGLDVFQTPPCARNNVGAFRPPSSYGAMSRSFVRLARARGRQSHGQWRARGKRHVTGARQSPRADLNPSRAVRMRRRRPLAQRQRAPRFVYIRSGWFAVACVSCRVLCVLPVIPCVAPSNRLFRKSDAGCNGDVDDDASHRSAMSAFMDMYFGNSDPLSLQEMLDIDIKSEIDTLIGGSSDLSGFNFTDLPPLEMGDMSDIRWFSHNSSLSNSSFTHDFSGDDYTMMVDPNAVMPIISSLSANARSPSPSLKESHLTFSPASIKINGTKTEVAVVKKDLNKLLDDGNISSMKAEPPAVAATVKLEKPAINLVNATVINRSVPTSVATHHHFIKKASAAPPIINTIKKVTPIISKGIVKVTKTPLLSFRNTVGGRQISSPTVTVAQLASLGQMRTITATPTSVGHARKQQFTNNRIFAEDVKPFPKPAYSYSCLIAMALKNSKTGSLPVSEIYNFMCRHFPFFKTAPNGWKNSVRHNLSLNKCFEKIEKPALNGAQRKGCLWAMNESKITKMDDEVQKWSKKDPSAIRRAMANPSNLEALERGELKFSCSYDDYGEDNFGDSCGSAESEGSDFETEMDATPATKIIHAQPQYISIANIKPDIEQELEEDDDEEEEEADEFDVEVADSLYDDENEIDEDSEILHMEMALAQKELLEYAPAVRRRKNIYIIQN